MPPPGGPPPHVFVRGPARDYGLFDFRVDPDGRPWFLEAGLYCSFARTSVVVMMAAQGGVPLEVLFAEMVTRAARRRA